MTDAGVTALQGALDHSAQARIDFIRERLRLQMRLYRRKWLIHRLIGSGARLLSILMGASVTVLLGLRTSSIFHQFDSEMSDTALILSGIMTIITGWEAFAEHSLNWVRYRTILHELSEIEHDFEYAVSGKSATLTPNKIDEINERLVTVILTEHKDWTITRAKSITRI
jgi:hypothetical protein